MLVSFNSFLKAKQLHHKRFL